MAGAGLEPARFGTTTNWATSPLSCLLTEVARWLEENDFTKIELRSSHLLFKTLPHAKTYVFLSFLTSMIILSPEIASLVALIQIVGL